jgi:sialate O-acetylesterase
MTFRLLAIFLLSFSLLNAQITLPPFFADNMVLQQQAEVGFWGKARPGSSVQISTSWNNKKYTATADANGKWKTRISTPSAGGPYEIRVTGGNTIVLHDVLIGEVWLCGGQSNMEMPMKGFRDQPVLGSNDAIYNSTNDKLRLFTVPRSVKTTPQDTVKHSTWKKAEPESVSNFSATAYYFGRMLQERLKVPVGLVHISYSGSAAEAWMSEAALKEFPEIKIPKATDSTGIGSRTATVFYNGMIGPFFGYGIKGAIWYQGESNKDNPDQYEKLFPAMVRFWREQSGQGDFPFYYVQIAPYNYGQLPTNSREVKANSAFLRDVQRKCVKIIPNSGMAVVMDIGEESLIHPANKEAGGKRLALMALAKTYGLKGFAYTSPSYESMSVSGSLVTIRFTDAPNGLTSFTKPLTHFEVAGADKFWRPAKASIRGGAVVVSSPDVATPVAVRYAFRDWVVGDLYSTEGFPVSSFRTDDW